MEMATESPLIAPYLTGGFIITDLTLVEFCGVILMRYNEQTSDYWFKKLQPHAHALPQELLYEAVKFRWKQKHGKMSFPDAVAYIFARKQGCTLVTTDNDFKHLPGVDLVQGKEKK